jgi:quercetin dioxygenase-like cupin family protein
VMGVAQIPPNTCFDRHMHPGVESAYMLEGEVLLKIEGSPDKDVKAGSGTQIPPAAPHVGCTQAAGAKVLTVHVVEKGKAMTSPAP